MGDAVKIDNIHLIGATTGRVARPKRARSSIILEILPDGTLSKTFVNVAQEDCVEMLTGLAMAQIKVLNTLQGS